MVFWNLEQIPPYRRLLDAILDEAVPFLPKREGRMGRREAFLFLSAPNSVTPVHFDPEHNFLLQIRGSKEMNIGRFPDRAQERRELETGTARRAQIGRHCGDQLMRGITLPTKGRQSSCRSPGGGRAPGDRQVHRGAKADISARPRRA